MNGTFMKLTPAQARMVGTLMASLPQVMCGHFWIVRDGEIIDPKFADHTHIQRVNRTTTEVCRIPASEAVQRVMIASHLKKCREHIGENPGEFFSRVMGRPFFGQCFFNCLMEQHERGGEIVFGSMGWVREDGSKYYEYGGENFKIVADFTGKTSVYMDDIRANMEYNSKNRK
jgi:hypothetical protein